MQGAGLLVQFCGTFYIDLIILRYNVEINRQNKQSYNVYHVQFKRCNLVLRYYIILGGAAIGSYKIANGIK